ncbi:class I adenylate-forming enzyme family protein [Modestobacter sp. Leaf380]|uniref:class I adenylate-forming enzyme family protein n=1 Tax=Modestobacter sp. Leaf380 TaxID=1736356 RepID=UPI0006F32EA4|nr:class I adenylate-forming enzyme family protein [Modestobacter sp. Leaf380]KQS72153.1 acyl--CoA ligase [Modestobacter sp. Leaf380]
MTRHPVPPAQRRAALEERFPVWVPRTLSGAMDAAAAEFGARPFLITDRVRWTYADVVESSRRLAAGFAGLGVQPGEHVAVAMTNHAEFAVVVHALSRLGATAVLVDAASPTAVLGSALARWHAVALVVVDSSRGRDHLAVLDELAPGWESGGGGTALPELRHVVVFETGQALPRAGATTLAELGRTAPAEQETPADPQATAVLLSTSGTTGRPRGVPLTHDMLLRAAYSSVYGRAFADAHRLTSALPLHHVYGLVEGLLTVPFVGGALVAQLSFDAAGTVAAIEEHRCDDALLIPTTTLAVLAELHSAVHDTSSLTHLFCSGGVAPAGLWDDIDAVFGDVEVVTGYGQSETTATTACTRPEDPPDRRRTTNGRVRDAGVAGDPALDRRLVVYRTCDPVTGADLAPGEVGELLARGPGVVKGYFEDPAADAAAFTADSWLRTGDLGTVDAEGWLRLTGRVKDVYRCGGEQVVPGDVEAALAAHPSVARAHVVPLPDDRMGEVGVAWVVPAPDAVVDEAGLVAWCAEHLPRHAVPRHVLAIDADDVPVTPSGRPRTFLLAERARQTLLPQRNTTPA